MLSAFSQAWASWKTAPGVALLAVVACAVGIGSATAIFTVINGVLLRPLPYPNSERLVSLYGTSTTTPGSMMGMSVPELQDYQQQTTSFDAFGWFRVPSRYQLTAPGEPQSVPGTAVTPALARQLGPPLLGQWFADDDSAVISYVLWQRLGGGRDIIGTSITLDERRYIVSGVMPPAFRLPIASLGGRGDTEVWIPFVESPADANRNSRPYTAYARRKPGVSLEQARADVKRVAAIVAATDPKRYPFYTADAADLREPTSPESPSHAAGPARRRRAPAPHCVRQRRHAAAGAIGRPRARDGDPCRARRLAAAARAALLRGGRAGLRRRRRRRRWSQRDLRPADPDRRGPIRPAYRLDHDRLEGARLQRGGGGRHWRARRHGPALAGDAHGAERGALRRRSRLVCCARATPVESVRRRRNRPRVHAPDDVGRSRRPPAQPGPGVHGVRP